MNYDIRGYFQKKSGPHPKEISKTSIRISNKICSFISKERSDKELDQLIDKFNISFKTVNTLRMTESLIDLNDNIFSESLAHIKNDKTYFKGKRSHKNDYKGSLKAYNFIKLCIKAGINNKALKEASKIAINRIKYYDFTSNILMMDIEQGVSFKTTSNNDLAIEFISHSSGGLNDLKDLTNILISGGLSMTNSEVVNQIKTKCIPVYKEKLEEFINDKTVSELQSVMTTQSRSSDVSVNNIGSNLAPRAKIKTQYSSANAEELTQ
ncbi:MAG: hypothetical protein OIF36_02410 [Alphaproteobacteria bacterium]|nr:hypothetical protein [Alphaproteobacteria bacterium]